MYIITIHFTRFLLIFFAEFVVQIKVYHPPPEPPPVPSIVYPLSTKTTDGKKTATNTDLLKAGVRRSFASSEEYEDRDGKSHAISISDGESENYYAGIYKL